MRKIFRDIPSSLLLCAGMVIMMFMVSYCISFGFDLASVSERNNKNISKYSKNYYLYVGDVTVIDGAVSNVHDLRGTDLDKLAKLLTSDKLDISMRINMPLEEGIIKYSLRKDNSDIYVVDCLVNTQKGSSWGDVKENEIFLNKSNMTLVKDGYIRTNDFEYKIKDSFYGNTAAVIVYDALDDDNKAYLQYLVRDLGRIKVAFLDDEEIDIAEVNRIASLLEENGAKLMADNSGDQYNDFDSTFIEKGGVTGGFGLIFVVITMLIIIKLWIVERKENLAILWSHGCSNFKAFLFMMREAVIIYGIAILIYAVIQSIFCMAVRKMELIYVCMGVVGAFVLFVALIFIYYVSYRKILVMTEVLNGGAD